VLAGVLARTTRKLDGFPVLADATAFFTERYDLIIEAGGPEAFRSLVPLALAHSEVWAVSPIPLGDRVLEQEIRRVVRTTGRALRIAPGALAGFDGIAAAMAVGLERLDVFVELGPGDGPESELLYQGTAREVALRFPDGVNVAVAAAIAGPGLDDTQVRVLRPPKGTRGRTMGFTVRSPAGVFEITATPRVAPAEDVHAVAASLIAMLRGTAAGITVVPC